MVAAEILTPLRPNENSELRNMEHSTWNVTKATARNPCCEGLELWEWTGITKPFIRKSEANHSENGVVNMRIRSVNISE